MTSGAPSALPPATRSATAPTATSYLGDRMTLPKELPRVPTGFTQRLAIHLKLTDGAMATHSVHDPDGRQLPVTYQYKTDKRHDYAFRGYVITGSDVVHETWASLAAAWPVYIKALVRLQAKGMTEDQAIAAFDSRELLRMIVIYDRPRDLPDGFVVRSWTVKPGNVVPGELIGRNLADLEAARRLVPDGLVNIGRTPDDDAKIVEVWV